MALQKTSQIQKYDPISFKFFIKLNYFKTFNIIFVDICLTDYHGCCRREENE